MRCVDCNKPFTPTQTTKSGQVMFSKTCSSCNRKYFQGYANSHEHVLGMEDEPLFMLAKTGSIQLEN